MADDTSLSTSLSMPSPLFVRLGDRYGPYAFGVVSLLIIWGSIVSPQLAATKVDYESHQKIVDQMRDIVSMQRELAATLKDAILAMDRLATRTGARSGSATSDMAHTKEGA